MQPFFLQFFTLVVQTAKKQGGSVLSRQHSLVVAWASLLVCLIARLHKLQLVNTTKQADSQSQVVDLALPQLRFCASVLLVKSGDWWW